jgi:hypothetical protein
LASSEQADEDLGLRHDGWNGRGHQIRSIRADHEIDFVHVEQLRIDPGHIRRIGLVIVIDELHGPTEQAALGIDFFLPDLGAEQRLLAGPGERAGLRHAEADLDRFAAILRVSRRPREHRRDQGRAMPALTWRRVMRSVMRFLHKTVFSLCVAP